LENLHNDFEQLWVAPEQQSGKLLLAGAGPTWIEGLFDKERMKALE
jgi:hypothetical protein